MPFKSRELFHYFYQTGDIFGDVPKDRKQDCLTFISQDPSSLRNSLLIAGLHYAWNVGELSAYESTFLFHKIETMQSVNEWLKNPDASMFTACVRQIATLCFAECCLGDIAIAETHLDGLMTIMDHQTPCPPSNDGAAAVEEELADRYVILTYNFVYGIKSRLQDMSTASPDLSEDQTNPSEIQSLMRKWHNEERNGLKLRLKAMRMFPNFFSPLPNTTEFRDIDCSTILECIKALTEVVEVRRLNPSLPYGECSRDLVWLEGGAARLLLAFVHSHVESMSPQRRNQATEKAPGEKFESSWSGMSIATGLYVLSILGLWNAGEPIEDRLHGRVLSILQRDLKHSYSDPGSKPAAASDMWFWKAFVGAFSITKRRNFVSGGVVQELQRPFNDFIRHWSRVTNTTRWVDARARLKRVVWPIEFWEDDIVQQLWERSRP